MEKIIEYKGHTFRISVYETLCLNCFIEQKVPKKPSWINKKDYKFITVAETILGRHNIEKQIFHCLDNILLEEEREKNSKKELDKFFNS